MEGKTNFDGAIHMKMRIELPPFEIIGIPVQITCTQEILIIKKGKESKNDVPETEEDEPAEEKNQGATMDCMGSKGLGKVACGWGCKKHHKRTFAPKTTGGVIALSIARFRNGSVARK